MDMGEYVVTIVITAIICIILMHYGLGEGEILGFCIVFSFIVSIYYKLERLERRLREW